MGADVDARWPEDYPMPFGMHRDKTLGEILQDDPTYLDWLRDAECNASLARAVKAMCEKYAAEIDRAIEARQR